ncbi:MAG: GNAT family N-acetyltransferase [Bacteroidota bacterium]
MLSFLRTDANHTDFKALVAKLDAYLAIQDGDEHSFYDQYNQIHDIKYAIVGFQLGQAVACGAIKAFSDTQVEVKRMYVSPEVRGQGIASALLMQLENWAAELGYKSCVLETGKRQPEAVALYHKNGYRRIPNYGQYAQMDNSLCFEKLLR